MRQVPDSVPVAKGAICYCLDEISIGPGARARVQKLSDTISDLAPSYSGLVKVFDEFLVSYKFTSAATREEIAKFLSTYWFDPKSPDAFFPGVPVARIYAKGVLQALKMSLEGKGPAVPVNSWWLLGAPKVELLSMADQQDGVTIGGNVTLLIATPRPTPIQGMVTPPWILGDKAEAYVTRQRGHAVRTKRIRDIK